MRKRTFSEIRGYIFSIAIFIIVIVVFVLTVNTTEIRSGEKWLETKKNAVIKAVVSCYAIEGAYPPNVDYLRQNYGLQVDPGKYIVHYEIFASNVMPDIDVFRK